jgi:uncharacterized protein (TIGR03435 family)
VIRTVSRTVLLAAAAISAAAQSFEVASIKPAAPPTDGRIAIRMGGDAGRIDYVNVSLKNIITRAFRVRPHQIQGPAWLDSERFDVVAKIPEGVPQTQVPEMLQALLAERFGMVARREEKEQPVYALMEGKNGHKLQKAKEDDPNAPAPTAPNGGIRFNTAGGATVAPRGGALMMRGPGGGASFEAKKINMARLADMLSNFMDRPVIDETKIEGEYDVKLDMTGDEPESRPDGAAPAAASPGPGGHGGAPVMRMMGGGPPPGIFSALANLGLRVEPKKAPVTLIVIDKIERTPTEN